MSYLAAASATRQACGLPAGRRRRQVRRLAGEGRFRLTMPERREASRRRLSQSWPMAGAHRPRRPAGRSRPAGEAVPAVAAASGRRVRRELPSPARPAPVPSAAKEALQPPGAEKRSPAQPTDPARAVAPRASVPAASLREMFPAAAFPESEAVQLARALPVPRKVTAGERRSGASPARARNRTAARIGPAAARSGLRTRSTMASARMAAGVVKEPPRSAPASRAGSLPKKASESKSVAPRQESAPVPAAALGPSGVAMPAASRFPLWREAEGRAAFPESRRW